MALLGLACSIFDEQLLEEDTSIFFFRITNVNQQPSLLKYPWLLGQGSIRFTFDMLEYLIINITLLLLVKIDRMGQQSRQSQVSPDSIDDLEEKEERREGNFILCLLALHLALLVTCLSIDIACSFGEQSEHIVSFFYLRNPLAHSWTAL